jgi:hypothetical protein
MLLMRKALLISGLFAFVWNAPAAARSPEGPARDLDLTYRVYYGGFEVLRLSVDFQMAPKSYEMELKFRTLGMIGSLFPWTMKAYARGRLTKDGVHPIAAGHRNSWRGKKRWLELRYPDRRPVVTDAHPVPKEDKPAAESLHDAIDLASAVIAMTRKFDQSKRCGLNLPVFDGRRRYDLVFKGDGEGAIRRNGYSAYAGPVVKCRVEMNRLAGFKTRHKSYGGWGEGDRAALVSMGRPFVEGPPVPVKIEIQTRWGDVMAHLTGAKLAADGTTRELAQRQ